MRENTKLASQMIDQKEAENILKSYENQLKKFCLDDLSTSERNKISWNISAVDLKKSGSISIAQSSAHKNCLSVLLGLESAILSRLK